jgi:hypothetical protein
MAIDEDMDHVKCVPGPPRSSQSATIVSIQKTRPVSSSVSNGLPVAMELRLWPRSWVCLPGGLPLSVPSVYPQHQPLRAHLTRRHSKLPSGSTCPCFDHQPGTSGLLSSRPHQQPTAASYRHPSSGMRPEREGGNETSSTELPATSSRLIARIFIRSPSPENTVVTHSLQKACRHVPRSPGPRLDSCLDQSEEGNIIFLALVTESLRRSSDDLHP